MLQKRSAFAHEGGTWSCAGGALDEGESPLEGALREASEEVGAIPAGHRSSGSTVFAPGDRLVVHDVRGGGHRRVRFVDQLRDRRGGVGHPRRGRTTTAPRRVRGGVARTPSDHRADVSDQFFPYDSIADGRRCSQLLGARRRRRRVRRRRRIAARDVRAGRHRHDGRQRPPHGRSPARTAGTRRSASGSASPTTASRSAPTIAVGCASSSSSGSPG